MTWLSSLNLSFDYVTTSQKTRLCTRAHSGALMVQRPLYPESNKQTGICHIYVLYPPAGIAEGDQLTVDLQLQENSHAVITTPGAGKWYGRKKVNSADLSSSSNANSANINSASTKKIASQNISAKIQANATLEWLPQESIYYDNSFSNAFNRFELAQTAGLLTWDIAVFGRQAYNETFISGEYSNRLEIWRDKQLLISEHTCQSASSRWFKSPLGLNSQHVHGSFWAVPSCEVVDSAQRHNPLKLGLYLDDTIIDIRALIEKHALPIDCTHNYLAINCRYLGVDVRACFEAFYLIRELLRAKWYKLEPHRPRIWDT